MSGINGHSAPLTAGQIIAKLTAVGYTPAQSDALADVLIMQAEIVMTLSEQGFELPLSLSILEGYQC